MKKHTFFRKLLSLLLVLVVGFAGGAASSWLILSSQAKNWLSSSAMTTKTTNGSLTLEASRNQTSTTEAVKVIQDAVVSVVNYQTQSEGNSIYNQIFGRQTDTSGGELVVNNEGSGVIYKIDGGDAYLVTNNHVVDLAEKIEIILANGTRVDGQVIGADTYSDLAVVKISSQGIETVGQFADSEQLTIGEPAIAIGSPLGSEYANSVTEGIVSSLSRTVTSTNDFGQTISTNAIQTDAAINPGNSGGPLINIQGQIIGINSSKITSSRSNVSVEGMGFAIPSKDVLAIIAQLEEHGQVIRPAIGINMANLSEVPTNILPELNLPEDVTEGIVVADVVAGMPAEGVLEQYDLIVAINEEEVKTASDLQSILYKHQLGDTINVTLYRKQKKETVAITLTKTSQDLNATN